MRKIIFIVMIFIIELDNLHISRRRVLVIPVHMLGVEGHKLYMSTVDCCNDFWKTSNCMKAVSSFVHSTWLSGRQEQPT